MPPTGAGLRPAPVATRRRAAGDYSRPRGDTRRDASPRRRGPLPARGEHAWLDSNQRPPPSQGGALSTELQASVKQRGRPSRVALVDISSGALRRRQAFGRGFPGHVARWSKVGPRADRRKGVGGFESGPDSTPAFPRLRARQVPGRRRSPRSVTPSRCSPTRALAMLTYASPVSNDAAWIAFRRRIAADQALRTGTYAKTLTFTLSTTTPGSARVRRAHVRRTRHRVSRAPSRSGSPSSTPRLAAAPARSARRCRARAASSCAVAAAAAHPLAAAGPCAAPSPLPLAAACPSHLLGWRFAPHPCTDRGTTVSRARRGLQSGGKASYARQPGATRVSGCAAP